MCVITQNDNAKCFRFNTFFSTFESEEMPMPIEMKENVKDVKVSNKYIAVLSNSNQLLVFEPATGLSVQLLMNAISFDMNDE